jgi:hypothetical protein
MKKEKIKKRKTYDLRLTRTEIAHLRDLFSVVLPPDIKKTLSQHLAELEDRSFVEEKLWDKISDLCNTAEVPLDEEAPDYIVAPSGPPPMGVFHLSNDVEDEQGEIEQEEE